jgi:hypothetical protein
VERVEIGQEDDALLLIGVGAGDDGDGRFRGAGVVGQVWDVGRDVEEVGGVELDVVLEVRAVPHSADAAEHVDGAFMGGVFVGFGAAAGRDGEQLHVEGLGTDALRGDGRGVHEALFALEGLAGVDEVAGGVGGGGFGDGRHHRPRGVDCYQGSGPAARCRWLPEWNHFLGARTLSRFA